MHINHFSGDSIDTYILSLLNENSRMSLSDIAKKVSLSVSATRNRIHRLEDAGVIAGYTILLGGEEDRSYIHSFCLIDISEEENTLEDFISYIQASPEVTDCWKLMGEYQFLIRIKSSSSKSLDDFLMRLRDTISIKRTNTIGALNQVKGKDIREHNAMRIREKK